MNQIQIQQELLPQLPAIEPTKFKIPLAYMIHKMHITEKDAVEKNENMKELDVGKLRSEI